jgi:hypothetical protein
LSAPIFDGTSPLISDRFILRFIAGEDLVAGVLVELTAAWTVKKPTAANSKKVMGITLTAAKNGASVSVVNRGLCRALMYGSVSPGDQLVSSGDVGYNGYLKADNSTLNTTTLGQAVESISSGGTGCLILW